jgi:hypothetical protein
MTLYFLGGRGGGFAAQKNMSFSYEKIRVYREKSCHISKAFKSADEVSTFA